ncbi:MAG: hypothetical protein ABIF77_02025 [bacterium]
MPIGEYYEPVIREEGVDTGTTTENDDIVLPVSNDVPRLSEGTPGQFESQPPHVH